ncbi:MAG: hypothetical protein MUP45_01365 [Candidatus Marinimicrobia bacterium]|nr:hypothetical protein [Candidatus Neomarinimicrobiota bacterium]
MKSLFKLIAILLFAFAIVIMAKPILATCDEQYGGVCKELELQIDKKIWDPANNSFKENLGIHDYKFGPDEEITFKLKIKNTGDEKFDEVHVKDYLPDYLLQLSGDFDFTLYDLDPDEEVEKEIKVKVVSASEFPDGQSIICVVNTAEAWNDEEKDKDTAQVCLEEKVLGVTELPPTGPENWFILLGLSVTSALIGLFLLNKAKDGNWKIA